MRIYIMNNAKYNEDYNEGEDSEFNTRVIRKGYNITI